MATRKCPFCKGTGVDPEGKKHQLMTSFSKINFETGFETRCLDCEGTGRQHKGWIAGSGSGSQSKPTGSNIRSSSGHYVVY
tara:strand:- start:845 stop:1087 length:243 start_codon:yes stop_codon:yes gene_type:complete